MADSLDRFVTAQENDFGRALAELRAGAKRSHWMWFIFPQLRGLGRSETARFYGIADADEARRYLAHPLLRTRLDQCCEALLLWTGQRTAPAILGSVDSLKLASSMTLFEAAGGGPLFGRVLDEFCAGRRDALTLELLAEART